MAFIISTPLLIPYIKSWESRKEIQLKQEFIKQFKEYLLALAAAMGTGYAVENAMESARIEMTRQYKSEIRFMRDLETMERLLRMNVSVEVVWKQWAKIVDIPELKQFATVFIVAKKSGGDSVQIIRKSISNICEKIELEQEIQVALVAKRLEFQVMSFIPIGILMYMRLSFSEFMDVLYGDILGWFIMTICLIIYAIAYMWGERIIEIEV